MQSIEQRLSISQRLCRFFLLFGLASSFAIDANADDSLGFLYNAASQKQWHVLEKIAVQKKNPETKAFIQWMCYKNKTCPASATDMVSFIRQNPTWPDIKLIQENAEQALVRENNTKLAMEWFSNHEPQGLEGMMIYLKAVEAQKGREAFSKEVKRFWRGSQFIVPTQQKFLSLYKAQLNVDDHVQRFNFLIEKNQLHQAEKIIPHLPNDQKALASAKLALAQNHPAVAHALQKVPQSLRNDATLNYLRVKWRHKRKADKEALELLESKNIHFPQTQNMWVERNYYARALLKDKQYQRAYKIASQHGLKEGASFADAEFLSGWIALKFLKNKETALNHFTALQKATSSPISQSRAYYWMAKVARDKNDSAGASQYLTSAAQFPNTYYGQLAAKEQGQKSKNFIIDQLSIASDQKQAFQNDPRVKLAKQLIKVNRSLSRSLIRSLANSAETKEQYYQTAELAQSLKFIDLSARIARQGMNANMGVFTQAFPVLKESPVHKDQRKNAMTHALIRQESDFKADALSNKGAVGLMQLLPATAKIISKKESLSYSPQKLKGDPAFNMKLGTSFFNQLMDRFDGSKVLAIAAYNAGPNRVSEWIKEYGHPKELKMSEADWIEMIPFQETRNYVQRVLENSRVYKVKLSQSADRSKVVSVNDLKAQ